MHGYEIEFVFGAPLKNSSTGYRRREVILSKKMMQYWSSFANDGYNFPPFFFSKIENFISDIQLY